MTVHIMKEALSMVPAIAELCKTASITDGLSTATKVDTLASATKLVYLDKVAHAHLDPEDVSKVGLAVKLYGLTEKVAEVADLMVRGSLEKKASENNVIDEVRIAEMVFSDRLSGVTNLEKVAHIASKLYDTYSDYIESPLVKRYACVDYLNKEAAVTALNGRHAVMPGFGFDKIATIVESSDETKLTLEDLRNISSCVTHLDKKAGLSAKGYNFYAEGFITKQALCSSLQIKVDNVMIPVENILRAPIEHILGQDVNNAIGGDPQQAKAVIESLPLESQRLLLTRVR